MSSTSKCLDEGPGNGSGVEPIGKTGRFARSDRLLDSKDFRRVLRRGRRRAHPDLVVISTPNPAVESVEDSSAPGVSGTGVKPSLTGRSRLGITASRKVGNAVIRNRFKRRVRAWFRIRRHEFPRDVDLVVIARKSGSRLSFDELDARLSDLMKLPPRTAALAESSDLS